MKRYKFNTRVGRSYGIGAYQNRGSDYYEYAPLFRTCCECGRTDIINALVDYSTTIYGSASDYSTMRVDYSEISTPKAWDKNFWLHEEFVSFRTKEERLKDVFNYIVKNNSMDFFEMLYTPIYWDNPNENTKKDFMPFVDMLIHKRCMSESTQLCNFALRVLDDGRRVLYGRNKWLYTFRSGCDLINYYRLARKRNFEKVYKF